MPNIALNVLQDNIYSGSNLLPVHSPLAFIIEITYTGFTPTQAGIIILDENDALLKEFKMIPFESLTGSMRFIFYADEILKSYMNELQEFTQTENSLTFCSYLTRIMKLQFTDYDVLTQTIDFNFIHAAKQINEYPNCKELFVNDSKNYFGTINNPIYAYFYNSNIANVLTITKTKIL